MKRIASIAVFLLILSQSLAAANKAPSKKQPNTPGEAHQENLDEISDNSGKIIRVKVIRITEKEVVFTAPESTEEKKLATENLIFVRSAKGEYRFFFPADAPSTPAQTKPAATESGVFEITAGVTGHFADNSATGDYVTAYGGALAKQYGQLTGTSFQTNQTRDASGLQWHFFAEPRLYFENFILGASAGYAVLPRTSAVVSSANLSAQTTINMDGYFFPVAAIFYYRLISDGAFGFNLGAGAGVLYSSVRLALVGNGSSEQVFASYNPLLVFKPEMTYRFGPVNVLVSIPIYWAAGRDVDDGEVTLLQVNSTNVVSPNLSGIGVALAVGVRF